eukprot:339538_1
MAVATHVFCVLFITSIISATNNTDILVTHPIAIDSIQFHTTATDIPIEYDTIYDIWIDYKYDRFDANTDLQNIFAASTVHAFKQFHLTIFNPTYCFISGRRYTDAALCTHYTHSSDPEQHGAYGIFVGKASNHNDYAITHDDPFITHLTKYIRKRIHAKSFSILSVNVSVVDTLHKPTQDHIASQTSQIIPILGSILSIEWYILLALCAVFGSLLLISKAYGRYAAGNRDDIQFVYFLYFVVFSLNFFTNSMMFTLRLFEQQRYILATFAVLFFVAIRIKYDVSIALESKARWNQSAFIKKRVNQWFHAYQYVFIALSLISGPVGAVTFVNSRLFIHNIFLMNIPQSMIVAFISDLFWQILLIQRFPEFVIQIMFVAINGYDHYVLCAHITTLICIILLYPMKLRTLQQPKDVLAQQSAFLMEISSEEINKNATKYIVQSNVFREVIAETLELEKDQIELLSFEAINVSTELNYNNSKVSRCYGLKIYIALSNNSMLRRYALMKLEKAKHNQTLMNKLKDAWDLQQMPSIDDIVMVYDLSGDLVIQRACSWDEATNPESIKLREIQENNLKYIVNERTEHIAEMQREMEGMLKEEQDMETCTQLNTNNSFDIYLNDQAMEWKGHKSKMKIPSKMHVSDTSIVSIEMPFDEGINDSLVIQMQRVQSDSLVRQMSI